jgi:DNA-binding beta-propeller fold protein YncE
VNVYNVGQNNGPVEQIFDGLTNITGDVAVDQTQKVYVTTSAGWVLQYPRAGLVPELRYQFPDQHQPPLTGGTTVGNDGTLYAALFGDALVAEYEKGKPKKAVFTIPAPSGQDVYGVAVDSQSNVYIEYGLPNQPGHIEKCPARSTQCTDLGVTLGAATPHLALDSQGNLIACDGAANQIDIFPPNGGKPRVISQGLVGCPFFALNKAETRLFVANTNGKGNQGISVFDYASGNLLSTITQGIPASDFIFGVAVSPAGQ